MTFEIKSNPDSFNRGFIQVSITHAGPCLDGYMTPEEWDAFRSLLIPSVQADFVLKEDDDKGE